MIDPQKCSEGKCAERASRTGTRGRRWCRRHGPADCTNDYPGAYPGSLKCPTCRGTGSVGRLLCEDCQGKG